MFEFVHLCFLDIQTKYAPFKEDLTDGDLDKMVCFTQFYTQSVIFVICVDLSGAL